MFEPTLPPVAVVAANPPLRNALVTALKTGGWRAWGTENVRLFHARSVRRAAEMLLVHLDPMDPQTPDVLRRLRARQGLGIVVLSDGASADARTRALECGADHCLSVPPDPQELHCTLQALWRRLRDQSGASSPGVAMVDRVEAGGWALDLVARLLGNPSGASAPLSDQEASLIAALMRASDRIVSKPSLLAELYPDEVGPSPHRIEVILSRVRRKTARAGMTLPVRAVFGRGLMFLTDRRTPA